MPKQNNYTCHYPFSPCQFKCYVSPFLRVLLTCLNHSMNYQIPECMQLWVCFLEVINFLTLVNGPEPQELMEDSFRGSCFFSVCIMNKSASCWSGGSLPSRQISEYLLYTVVVVFFKTIECLNCCCCFLLGIVFKVQMCQTCIQIVVTKNLIKSNSREEGRLLLAHLLVPCEDNLVIYYTGLHLPLNITQKQIREARWQNQ